MLSVTGKNWKEIFINKRILEKVKIENNYSDLISKIIISRKFTQLELNSISNDVIFSNPFKKKEDFINGQKILSNAIKNKKKVLIIGDYDVDGCVSTSLLINFFRLLNFEASYYIPNRFKDGYGASLNLIKKLVKKKPELIIMVDCGSNSIDSINYLNSIKIQSIIIDHHEIFYPYPKSNILINPKKKCNYNNFDYLCSSTLVYFFLESLLLNKELKLKFKKNLLYVLLATICDVMPLRGLNRIIAIHTLKNLKIEDNHLFKKILKIKKIKRPLEINDLGFLIGPIINASGRLDDANKIIQLISNEYVKTNDELIHNLININEKRKNLENNILKELNIKKLSKSKDNVLIIYKTSLHEGIIGIIASRLKDYFDKPTIVLTKVKSGIYKASARSTSNFNIGSFIKKAIDKDILIDGGGHNLAAGFSIKKEKIENFKLFINNSYEKNQIFSIKEYVSKISLNAINSKFYNEIKLLGPFGPNNVNPLFLIENIKITKPKILGNNFVNFFAKSRSGKLVSSIYLNFLESEVSKTLLYNKNEIDLIVEIKENNWNNKKNLQLIVVDAIT